MNSCELAVSVSSLACCISEGKTAEEIALIGAIFMQLGDTLATIAAHQALCESEDMEKNKDINKDKNIDKNIECGNPN